MSWVANLMLAFDGSDEPLVASLSQWLQTECPMRESLSGEGRGVGSLRRLTGQGHDWGGWKNPEVELWAGVLNHADLDAVLSRLAALPWREPQWLQVLLKDQEEATFRLYMFDGETLRQYAPTRDHDGPRSY